MVKINPIRLEVDVVESDEKIPVKVVLDSAFAKMPIYSKDGDAGADICVIPSTWEAPPEESSLLVLTPTYYDEKLNECRAESGDWVISPGETVMLQTGLRIELLPGWEMQVRSRSGMAKHGLVVANSPGTIDSGYRGPCNVLLHNNTGAYRVIKPGTRVAQLVLKRAPQADFQRVEELSDSERGVGGFGSTGTK